MRPLASRPRRDVVLVGGGHAHVQLLRAFAMEPLAGARLTVVVDTPVAVYSGMVPGFVAGQYSASELEIDVLPLARRAGARVVIARCLGVDPEEKRLFLEGRPPLAYDLAAFDIGSTVLGLDTPGVRAHAVPTRPIGELVERIGRGLEALERRTEPLRVGVVGAGAGGVELAFTLDWRLRQVEGQPVETTLLQRHEEILPTYPPSLRRRVLREAGRRGIGVRTGVTVAAVDEAALVLADGERLPCDLPVWVVGAAAHGVFEGSGLPLDERGFLKVRPTLQVEGFDDLFASGDCASLVERPDTPKAGVYAVRQGPYLTDNLRARLAGDRLRRYSPQGDFLTLLNLGDGRALGSKWGVSFAGGWVFRLKDRIDRKFMRLFQVLEADGRETEEFAGAMAMEGSPMLCGGCAAKVGQTPLAQALSKLPPAAADDSVELGLAAGDDVVAWRTAGGERVVSSVDVLKAFTDDPWLVGRVAAANAVSDLWAKGVEPRWAQAVVTIPEALSAEEQEEALAQLLRGARGVLDAGGVSLLGGHTTTGPVLQAGFVVDGVAPGGRPLLRLTNAVPGQALVLTKALGTGVLFHADMLGRLRGPWFVTATAAMTETNEAAARAAVEAGATAATDVTGFGLVGHLASMMRASATSAVVRLDRLPALPGALELLAAGLRSTSHDENARALRGVVLPSRVTSPERLALVADPQTSGGLVFAIASELAASVVAELHGKGVDAATVIGEVGEARDDGAVLELV